MKTNKLKKLLAMLLAGVLAMLCLAACGKDDDDDDDDEDDAEPYVKVLDDYFKALNKCDGKLYVKTTYFDIAKEQAEDDLDEDYDSLEEYWTERLEDNKDYNEEEYGDNVKFSYEAKKAKELSKDKLSDIQESLCDRYDADSDEIKVTEGYEVKVKITTKGDDDEETDTENCYIYKINRQWVLSPYFE